MYKAVATKDGGIRVKMTDEEVAAREAEEAVVLAEMSAVAYIAARKTGYGDVGDQLDMMYWDAVNGTTEWQDHIAAVKAANPKPAQEFMTIECLRYKEFKKGSLLGFADIFVEKWGVEIKGFSMHFKDGAKWVNLPSKEFQNEEGEMKYSPVFKFRDTDHQKSFCKAVLEAINLYIATQECGPSDPGGYSDNAPF